MRPRRSASPARPKAPGSLMSVIAAALREAGDVVAPELPRRLFFLRVGVAVIDASDAFEVPGLMVQALVHHQRVNAERSAARGEGPPQVMQRIGRERRQLVERGLGLAVAG